MIEKEEKKFSGFSRKTLKFLRGLKENNDKAWFQAHRANYEEYVPQPLRDWVEIDRFENDLARILDNLTDYEAKQ